MRRNWHRVKKTKRQVAALPYAIDPDGTARVLLITSRETKRWVIPKGNGARGLEAHQAAAREAFEEAGISGIPCPTPLGSFDYDKRLPNGALRATTVDVFPLAVLKQFDAWPERHLREQRWFPLEEAAAAVDEPELKALIIAFREPPRAAGRTQRALLWVREKGGENLSIVRWFQALMPKPGRYFELFEAHAQTLVDGAEALARLFQGEAIENHIKTIREREEEADDIIREILRDVRRTFSAPFDRSAIASLISSMDDVIDQMNQTAKAIDLYELRSFEPQMKDMSSIIFEAARMTAEAIPLLRSIRINSDRLHTLTERIVQVEGHADEIHAAGVKALFAAHAQNAPMQFIIGREVYSHLEKVVDSFEDVANEIQGLVIDHA